jgi:hypothetical protein
MPMGFSFRVTIKLPTLFFFMTLAASLTVLLPLTTIGFFVIMSFTGNLRIIQIGYESER